MAAIPSTINLIENHLACTYESKSSYSDDVIDTTDKEQLIFDVNLEPKFGDNERKEVIGFCQQYFCKFWPYRLLKLLNWLVLLLLCIGACLSASYPLWWSSYWKTVFYEQPYHQHSEWAVSQCILFALASISIMANIFMIKCAGGGTTFWAAFLALMDLYIWAFSIPILLIANMLYTLHALAEIRWFWPKLVQFNDTFDQAKLAELTETNFDPLVLYMPHYEQTRMELWYRQIWLHLVADPLISLLTAVAIPLNIALLVLICKMMRRANIWSDVNDNCKRQQDSQEHHIPQFEQQYCRHYPFRALNTTKWVFPLLIVFAFLYTPLFRINLPDIKFPMFLGGISACHFVFWLFYFCQIHFRQQNDVAKGKADIISENNLNGQLLGIFIMDAFLSFCSTFLLILQTGTLQSDLAIFVHLTLIALYFGSFALSCWLYYRTLSMFYIQFNVKMAVEKCKSQETNGEGGEVQKGVENVSMAENMDQKKEMIEHDTKFPYSKFVPI